MKQPWTKKYRLFTDICGRNLIQEPEEKPSEMVWSWDSVCQKLDTFSVFDLFHTWCSTTPFLSIILQYRSICHEYPWILWDCLGHSSWFYTMMWQLCVCVWGVFLVSHMTCWFVSTCENSAQLDQAVHEGQNLMYLIPKQLMADVSCIDPCTGRRVGTLHLTWHWLFRTIDVGQSSETDIIVLKTLSCHKEGNNTSSIQHAG